jgi:hypothetical protein
MADEIQDFITQIHDFTLEKSHIINDKNYRRYLPNRHKILRALYQGYIWLFILSILLVVLYFSYTETWLRALAYNAVLAIAFYSLFILILTLILYAAAYTVPIAVTNEVKAKLVMKINHRLDVLKESMQKALTKEIIEQGLHEGKFNMKDIKGSILKHVETGFPGLQYIKEIVNDEILKHVEKGVADYIAEMSNVLLSKVKDSAVKIAQVAEMGGTKPEFIVLMLRWMIDSGALDGNLTEFDLEYVPSGAISTTSSSTKMPTSGQDVVPVDGPIITPPAAQAQSGLMSSSPVLVQSPGTGTIPSIDGVKIRIDDRKQEIEALKKAFERGDLGIDAYVSKSELLEEQLAFLKHRLTLLEKVQNPKASCMVCFLSVAGDPATVKCPNGHVFHLAHAHDWLAKHEACPWCEETVSAFPSN